MTADRWRLIEDLFAKALEYPHPERQTFLQHACQGDADLQREIESLLDADAPGERLIELPLQDSDMSGRRIGPYRLIRLIGHGGMGAVYLGVRDDDQYRKQVAIKLLKRGMDTDFMLSRFRQERQILANLEHPFIARLNDGGDTDDGLPYLVMEFVDGVPITKYCDEKSLSITERIRLFRLVCEAVQYAHQNLVVHRDIKPSNILTTKEGVPKLLDFGIAKVLEPGASVGATLTRRELRMLTPDYASPEQVRGLKISTASDTYSLGAVLYELLAGRRAHQFASQSITDMERTICDVDPRKPSLAASKDLRRRLSGDLDNIILTAMRKEPVHRYASAAEFSEDLRRFLEGLPVVAHEDRWAYRTGKFIRRNRLAVTAGSLVIASLIGGIVATTVQARRAERRFQLARQLAKATLAEIKGPMERLSGATATRVSMTQTVVRYLDGLALEPGNDPEFKLEIADAYREVGSMEGHPSRQNLGQTSAALGHYQKALAIYEELPDRADIRAHVLGGLIGTNIEAGDIETRMGKAGAARERLRKVAAIAEGALARDQNAVALGTRVYLYFRLGDAERRAGDYSGALNYYLQALDVSRKWAAADTSSNARYTLRGAHDRVAIARLGYGELQGARAIFEGERSAWENELRQPTATPYARSMLASAHHNLSGVLGDPRELNFGDPSAALAHIRIALEIQESVAASDPHDVRARDDLAGSSRRLAAILLEHQPEEALRTFQKAAAISGDFYKADPSNTNYRLTLAYAQMGIGESLHKLGRGPEALQALTSARDKIQSLVDTTPDELSLSADLSNVHRSIGDAFLAMGDKTGAYSSYRLSLGVTEDLVRRAPQCAHFQRNHADSLEALGSYYLKQAASRRELRAEARAWLQKSQDIWRDWTRRKIAAPYASRRESQVAALIAVVDRN